MAEYTFKAPEIDQEAAFQNFAPIGTGHVKDKYWYRKYRSWADFWREVAGGALGVGDRQAQDPLAQLQGQLQNQASQVNMQNIYDQGRNFSPMVGAQQRAAGQVLAQRAAQLGIGGAFQGVMDENMRARTTLANQSLAAYRPQAYQAQQELNEQVQSVLAALAQAEYEAQASIEGAGRNA